MSSHEDAMRWARERQLQLQWEARRNATPRFGPAVDGVLWRGIRSEGDADTSLQTPILSILDFPLKAGINVRDESKPPRKLWDATLGYISSIPGCCGVEWGARLDAEAGILCLVYWDSVVAWHRFQHSLGCTPLIGLLSSSASNRCAKFAGRISGAPGLGEAAVRASPIVDVVSVTLGAWHVSSPERRVAFQEMWNTLVASLTGGEGDGGLRHSHAVWLENNASTFGDPTPAEAAAATVSATFTAFLVWDEENYDGHGVEYLCDGLRTSLPPSCGNEPTSISRKAVQLINQVQDQEAHDAPQQPVALLASLASILQGDFSRQCSADLFNLRAHAHQVLNSSISDAMAGKRLFPVPQGCFISQGELYEGNLPRIPEWRSRQEPLHGHHLVDIAWMQLKRRAVRTQGPRIYNRLNNEMSVLPGFVKAFWARDALDDTKLAVLTVWEHQHLQGAALHGHRRTLDDFAASSVHLSSPLTHQSFPMARDPVGITWLDRLEYLELTCFYIPPGALERQLLEHAYAAFARFVAFPYIPFPNAHAAVQTNESLGLWRISMTVPSQQGGIPAACTVIDDAGGWQPAEASESSGCQVFTAVLAWTSPAARLEWYEELAGASGWSYEMFGHKLDALKVLATGGVATRFLALQRQ